MSEDFVCTLAPLAVVLDAILYYDTLKHGYLQMDCNLYNWQRSQTTFVITMCKNEKT